MGSIDTQELYKTVMHIEPVVVVEHQLHQHKDLSKFGGGCVHTLRVVSLYRMANVIFYMLCLEDEKNN